MKSFAIVVVCYNRLQCIKRLLKSLEKADYDGRKDIDLIFSIDFSGVDDVKQFAESYSWEYGKKIVRSFSQRQGLKKHILSCGDFTQSYDILVVLEDDIWVSDSFYHYAYQAVVKYENNEDIAGISLYNFQKNWLAWSIRFEPRKNQYDAYFMKIAQSWGQVWTKNKWEKFKTWYLKNENFSYSTKIPNALFKWPDSSWLKYHTRYCIEKNKYFLYPYFALSSNSGNAGEHSKTTNSDYQVELQFEKTTFHFPDTDKNSVCYDEYMNPINIGRYIGIENENLLIDLYGTKQYTDSRYILTTKILNYEIIKSFALSFHPIEYSIINNIEGFGIFLYDTNVEKKNNYHFDYFQQLLYFSFRTYHLTSIIRLLILSVKKYIKRYVGIF